TLFDNQSANQIARDQRAASGQGNACKTFKDGITGDGHGGIPFLAPRLAPLPERARGVDQMHKLSAMPLGIMTILYRRAMRMLHGSNAELPIVQVQHWVQVSVNSKQMCCNQMNRG